VYRAFFESSWWCETSPLDETFRSMFTDDLNQAIQLAAADPQHQITTVDHALDGSYSDFLAGTAGYLSSGSCSDDPGAATLDRLARKADKAQ
jgi:hypothetical protein